MSSQREKVVKPSKSLWCLFSDPPLSSSNEYGPQRGKLFLVFPAPDLLVRDALRKSTWSLPSVPGK